MPPASYYFPRVPGPAAPTQLWETSLFHPPPHLLHLLLELAAQSLAPGKFLIPADCGSWVYSQLCHLGLPCPHCHMRPGLTRDPGLNILLPDLFFLPLASLPLKSTWEKNFLKRLKILGWGAAAAQGSGLGTGAPWSQRPGLIQVKGLLAFPHLIFSFPLPHLHLPHLHLPHLIPHSSLREWNPVRALFVLTRLQTPWGRVPGVVICLAFCSRRQRTSNRPSRLPQHSYRRSPALLPPPPQIPRLFSKARAAPNAGQCPGKTPQSLPPCKHRTSLPKGTHPAFSQAEQLSNLF